MRPLLIDPEVMPPGAIVQPAQTGGSSLAAALSRPVPQQALQAQGLSIPLSTLQGLANALSKPGDPVAAAMPGQTVDPRTGMGNMPTGVDPYAAMTAQQLAQQAQSVQPFGAPGTPSAQFNPPPAPPSWLDRMMQGQEAQNGAQPQMPPQGQLPPPVSSAPGWFDQGGALSRLFGSGGGYGGGAGGQ